MPKPSVLFVCVKNGGKSQMAAGLMRQIVGATVDVYSAGTKPATSINALSAESLLEVGVDITGENPKPIDPQLVHDVDVVVTGRAVGARHLNSCTPHHQPHLEETDR